MQFGNLYFLLKISRKILWYQLRKTWNFQVILTFEYLSTHCKNRWKFQLKISLVNVNKTANWFTFTKEILNGKLHFFAVTLRYLTQCLILIFVKKSIKSLNTSWRYSTNTYSTDVISYVIIKSLHKMLPKNLTILRRSTLLEIFFEFLNLTLVFQTIELSFAWILLKPLCLPIIRVCRHR